MNTENYNKALAQLNDAQRKAVQTTEGPVMVLAGPGTGKTQTLALRVAYILETTQMRPSNILCLTFSMAGVIAMRKRLRQIIGPDAYGVTVHTIHGFCNDIIMQYPDIFTDFKAREQISEVQQIRTVRAALQKLPTGSVLGAPSKSDNSIDRSSDILRRISDMKREGKSLEDLEKLIPQYSESIKYTPTGKERNLESKVYLNDARKVQQFKEFIEIYRAYQTSLNEKHLYDYNDMILVTHKVLKEQDWILATLQERYQYLLVDEFQDLNGAQTSIINILTTYPTGDTPNVFVVGDDDQAIYKFQGANLGNMLEFKQRYQAELITITLQKNYRSHQAILNACSWPKQRRNPTNQ